ncbi:MAG: hypothetical protein GKS00_27045 [Alphaproteobacteria bacterium]|nr:hypothetical protein [Alphaproteobacteria bacterium]
MLQVGIMIAIAAAMFWWLPLWAAVVGGIVLFFVVAAKLRDAVTRGRVHMIIHKDDDDEAQRIRDRDATFLYAMWIGLTIAGPAHSDGGEYIHHPGGGDFGGDIGGGHDGGGGGDGGM